MVPSFSQKWQDNGDATFHGGLNPPGEFTCGTGSSKSSAASVGYAPGKAAACVAPVPGERRLPSGIAGCNAAFGFATDS